MKKSNFPCNTTRFFFDKVEGKQFHLKNSGCDDFTVRLQVRKHKSVAWEEVAHRLRDCKWLKIFKMERMCSANATQLVATFRLRKIGDHRECFEASKSYRLALKEGKNSCDWPIKCKLRKK